VLRRPGIARCPGFRVLRPQKIEHEWFELVQLAVEEVSGAGHFFHGKLHELKPLVLQFLRS